MLLMRHLVEEKDGAYRACEEELPLLRYYANSMRILSGKRSWMKLLPEVKESGRSRRIS